MLREPAIGVLRKHFQRLERRGVLFVPSYGIGRLIGTFGHDFVCTGGFRAIQAARARSSPSQRLTPERVRTQIAAEASTRAKLKGGRWGPSLPEWRSRPCCRC